MMALVALAMATPARAQNLRVKAADTRDPAQVVGLVSTDTLAAWLARGPVRLLDARQDMFTYLRGHLPQAQYLNIETLRAAERGVPGQLLPGGWYADLFTRLGLSGDGPVVVYSAGESMNIDATFVVYLLGAIGQPKVYLLDGGYAKWELEQRTVAREYPTVTTGRWPAARSFRPARVTLDALRSMLEAGTVTLVDARPPDQFSGEQGSQMRKGHIPGAVNHYWADDLVRQDFGLVWKPLDQLRASYEAQGITPNRDIILYCNSTTEASHVFFALKYLLGYPNVRIYTGAWTEWAAVKSLPVATGP